MDINIDTEKMTSAEAAFRLRDLAQQAYGSGLKEGVNGGAGYIVINGRGIPIKVLTKLSERKWFDCDLSKDAESINKAIGLKDGNAYDFSKARTYVHDLIVKAFGLGANASEALKRCLGKDVKAPLERRQVAAAINAALHLAKNTKPKVLIADLDNFQGQQSGEKVPEAKPEDLFDIWEQCFADSRLDTGSVSVVKRQFETCGALTDRDEKQGLTSMHIRQVQDFDRQLRLLALYADREIPQDSSKIKDCIKRACVALDRMTQNARLSQGLAKLWMAAYLSDGARKLNAALDKLSEFTPFRGKVKLPDDLSMRTVSGQIAKEWGAVTDLQKMVDIVNQYTWIKEKLGNVANQFKEAYVQSCKALRSAAKEAYSSLDAANFLIMLAESKQNLFKNCREVIHLLKQIEDKNLFKTELQELENAGKWDSLADYDSAVSELTGELKAEVKYIVPNVTEMPTTDGKLQEKLRKEKDVAFKNIKLDSRISDNLKNSLWKDGEGAYIDYSKTFGENSYREEYENGNGFMGWSDLRGGHLEIYDKNGAKIVSSEDGIEVKNNDSAKDGIYNKIKEQFTHDGLTDENALRKFAYLCMTCSTSEIMSAGASGMKNCPPWGGSVVGCGNDVHIDNTIMYDEGTQKYTAHIRCRFTPGPGSYLRMDEDDGDVKASRNDFDGEKSFIEMNWDVTFDNDVGYTKTKVSTIKLSGRICMEDKPLLSSLSDDDVAKMNTEMYKAANEKFDDKDQKELKLIGSVPESKEFGDDVVNELMGYIEKNPINDDPINIDSIVNGITADTQPGQRTNKCGVFEQLLKDVGRGGYTIKIGDSEFGKKDFNVKENDVYKNNIRKLHATLTAHFTDNDGTDWKAYKTFLIAANQNIPIGLEKGSNSLLYYRFGGGDMTTTFKLLKGNDTGKYPLEFSFKRDKTESLGPLGTDIARCPKNNDAYVLRSGTLLIGQGSVRFDAPIMLESKLVLGPKTTLSDIEMKKLRKGQNHVH